MSGEVWMTLLWIYCEKLYEANAHHLKREMMPWIFSAFVNLHSLERSFTIDEPLKLKRRKNSADLTMNIFEACGGSLNNFDGYLIHPKIFYWPSLYSHKKNRKFHPHKFLILSSFIFMSFEKFLSNIRTK